MVISLDSKAFAGGWVIPTEKNLPKHLNQSFGAPYGNKSAIWEGTLRALGTKQACSCTLGKTGCSREKY